MVDDGTDLEMEAGLKLTLTFLGKPLATSEMLGEPLAIVAVIVVVPEVPFLIAVIEEGDALMV